MATSSRSRCCPALSRTTSARTCSAWPGSSYQIAQRCASCGVMVAPFILLAAVDLGDDRRRFFASLRLLAEDRDGLAVQTDLDDVRSEQQREGPVDHDPQPPRPSR